MATTPESELGQRLLDDLAAVTASEPPVDYVWISISEVTREVEREKEKSRVLGNYVVYLLDRVEKLERRLDQP